MTGRRLIAIAPLVIALAFLLVLPQPTTAGSPALAGKIVYVYDGDTIEVEHIGKVRLIGIDAPESEASPRDRYYLRQDISPATLRRIARQARAFLIANARGEYVSLTLDRRHRDRYGRLLAYVHLPDGRLLNRLLLEAGLASVYRRFEFQMKEDFLAAEAQARKRRIGMWQKP